MQKKKVIQYNWNRGKVTRGESKGVRRLGHERLFAYYDNGVGLHPQGKDRVIIYYASGIWCICNAYIVKGGSITIIPGLR